MNILEIKNLSRFFGGLAALKDVSFGVRQGHIVGLIGPNGSGKTTLFNVINGFYPPSSGDVFFKLGKISGVKPHVLCRLGIARTFQVVKPLQRLSVLDNVIASAFLRTEDKLRAEEIACERLVLTGLYEERYAPSSSLSLGKRKRLELARALATQPGLLLLDESFAGLNPGELDESIAIIRRVREQGVTVMIVEHHMKVIMALSDRIVVLNHGEKIAEGAPREIQGDRRVIEAYLGDAEYA